MAELVYQTIGQLLDEQAKKYPKHEALVYADRDLRLTYEELNQQSRLVARGLLAHGMKKETILPCGQQMFQSG
ncbi:AMP-binding protein OS=Lysinibacillus sphaericus OX=1421 GN=LS41612_20590 PE=3 SV=1 [Lysinibacillus sphaericus]